MNSKLLIFDLDDTLFVRDRSIKKNEDWEHVTSAEPSSGVLDFLHNFSAKKILVTKETYPYLQNKKIDLLGIREFFDKIYICHKNEEKKELFSKIIAENPDHEIWVMGDRIDSEIRYGNELGLITVLIKQGEYKNLKAKDNFEIPHHEIFHFTELENVLECKQ
ncbi:HAD hydrolase-like protein [Candidatus Woesearchaeota archaeon]|jgi:FMN phosphatase YigB (HAD superfamily)|nr:HAD hydrolase-like protein [Candidatus Woesearchaeota archaeon]MBT5396664.1 HAD hydrolase-like protein [Candidatus Woesearchaeota archaeon]MBT5924268.1 HAD hydrolase-like protein [Candidatus Woesearchaeota archaeon]MBT6367549.1 HAD hydrolase-like protein [Candidatus Woesearchaeota archaeon]MBT7763048.1 HAD hydrolase-like protein [Candidatus Woesearchaeota archaeon]